jgi:hypothetical protein
MRRNGKRDYEFSVERGNDSVEYVCEYVVSPGEPETPRTLNGPGEPGCGPEVDSKAVFFVVLLPCLECLEHRFKYAGRAACRECKRVREPRPEMDDLVTDEELIEAWGEAEGSAREAAAEARWEAARDERRYSRGG